MAIEHVYGDQSFVFKGDSIIIKPEKTSVGSHFCPTDIAEDLPRVVLEAQSRL